MRTAIEAYKTAIEICGDPVDVLARLATCQQELGRVDQAKASSD